MSEYEKLKRSFKKHYNYAMKLKEGGEAWEREINICNILKEKCIKLYNERLKDKYI